VFFEKLVEQHRVYGLGTSANKEMLTENEDPDSIAL